jgi:hypothetical protein
VVIWRKMHVLAGNPWEIERLIVSYPIKFYGHVSTHNEEGRQVRERRGFQGNSCTCLDFSG